MEKLTLLDLFCGCGGAAVGYNRAGFDIVGVDYEEQRSFPFEFEFIMEDLPEWLDRNLEWVAEEFDAIHASPPCQRWSTITPNPEDHPDLIAPIRKLLKETKLPYVIENVPGAPLMTPFMLCGSMFGLGVGIDKDMGKEWFHLRRHRMFETNFPVFVSDKCNCSFLGRAITVTGNSGGIGKGRFTVEQRKTAMGIDWMINEDLVQAIPPAYTEFIGKQLIKHITERRQHA